MKNHKCPHCGEYLDAFEPFAFGNIKIIDRGRILFDDEVLEMPKSIYDVTEALVTARGRALRRPYLAEVLGGNIYDDTVAVYIGRARSLFRKINPDFNQIASVKGHGAYRWVYRQTDRHSVMDFGKRLALLPQL